MSALSLTHTTRPRLGHLRQDELAELFSTLATADINALAGHQWHGRLLAPFAAQYLPRPLLFALSALLATPLNPWYGKSFEHQVGANHWFAGISLPFGEYAISTQNSPHDGAPVLWLDYNVTANPSLLRAIRGEVRTLSEGVFLARMNWQTAKGLFCVAYFNLQAD